MYIKQKKNSKWPKQKEAIYTEYILHGTPSAKIRVTVTYIKHINVKFVNVSTSIVNSIEDYINSNQVKNNSTSWKNISLSFVGL